MRMKKIRAIVSGGGTGGHIFPAISIANELKERFPDAEILFVGALGRMEMERVPAAGYRIVGLPVMGFPRKPSAAMFAFFIRLMKSMRQAKRIVREFKPDIAIGVGGYASGPLLRAAVGQKIPAILQEQNSYAGLTNKLLAAKVNKICVAYPNMERYFPGDKIVVTGNPVRRKLLEKQAGKEMARQHFKLNPDIPVVLILGGSLGARTINESVLASLELIENSPVQFIWQTGKLYYSDVLERLGDDKPKNLLVTEFLSDMDLAYAAADLVVSRAGAGTISELCLLAKPVILVPSPNVAEDHQTKNAIALVEQQAAVLVRDTEARETLINLALRLVEDETELKRLSENILKLAKPKAAEAIVDVIVKELRK